MEKDMKKITCKVGGTTIELRNVKEVYGHDDSIPFNADIYVQGVYAGYAYNDGWGGDSVIRADNEKSRNELQELSNKLKKMYVVYDAPYGTTEYLKASLRFLIDLMVEDCLYYGKNEYDFAKNFTDKVK